METPVVVVVMAVNTAAAPDAGNSGSGCRSDGGGVDVRSGKTAVTIVTVVASILPLGQYIGFFPTGTPHA